MSDIDENNYWKVEKLDSMYRREYRGSESDRSDFDQLIKRISKFRSEPKRDIQELD